MSKDYSRDIYEAVNSFLKEDDWHFSFNEENGIFTFGLNLKCRLRSIKYFLSVRQSHYVVYAVAPLNADHDDADVMMRMNEFINRANYGLNSGNFEMDNGDGEIRYKTYVDCADGIPGEETIRASIYVPAAMYERYGNGIVSIMFGDVSAEDAVNKCEADR